MNRRRNIQLTVTAPTSEAEVIADGHMKLFCSGVWYMLGLFEHIIALKHMPWLSDSIQMMQAMGPGVFELFTLARDHNHRLCHNECTCTMDN